MRILLLILLSLVNIACSQKIENQSAVTQTTPHFDATVYQLIDLFNKKNFKEINQYIDKDIGLFIVYNASTSPTMRRIEQFKSNNKITENTIPSWVDDELLGFSISGNPKIQYEQYPTFDPCSEKVTKLGLYANSKEKNIEALKIALDYYHWELKHYQFEKNPVWEEYQAIADKIAPKTVKVVYIENFPGIIPNHEKNIFIFYLTRLDNKWYLTILDFYTMDCSA
ncbi:MULTISPECIES: hypothetical protein [unclassified Gilliamella]|uniref:hypothetical protein n=1 Tax=unclassified Gilliamella TaxID=2685620 RepID=UPI00080ED29F|nr:MULTISPECIES: hypothetical protein [Gilliamella]MCX8575200.1 hypothetical protein [Gilliamella sp. B3831]MCX8577583.1 hypothetical protein [Gilliamella sp. B3815]MCX8590263.1 hypothetical protein [Gilliamella sp. B3812]MCX8597046.1 hypothetical protein [Gilliamella sp. B3493]MCX8599613.1 hypothetical protein [Gilliamella sp. B3486]